MTGQSLNVDQGVRRGEEPVLTAKRHVRADIQALRGVAIVLVVLHHCRVPGIPGGFLGVDIFFVISGFLMTGLIDEALTDRRFTLRSFYVRRIRRLFPAAYATLAITAIAAPFCLDSFEYRQFAAQLAGAFTFTVNFILWRQTDYFGSGATLKPLLHMWSLSIEEQFYLFLPLVLMVFGGRRRLIATAALTAGSLALCLVFLPRSPSAVFYLLPFRAWEMGIGAVTALLVRRDMLTRFGAPLPRMAAVVVLLIVPLLVDESGHPGLPALLVCFATAVLLVPAADTPRVDRLLKPLTLIGDRSYSLYLVHWPILAFANNMYLTPVPQLVNVTLLVPMLVWTELQYRLIEQPLRRFPMNWRTLLTLLLVPTIVIGGSYVLSERYLPGAPDRDPTPGLGKCDYPDTFSQRPDCATGTAPEVLVWGDSFAMQLAPGIAASTREPIIQATRTVCGPFLGIAPVNHRQMTAAWAKGCIAFNDAVADYLSRTPSIRTVVLSSPLTQYVPDAEDAPWALSVREGSKNREMPLSEEHLLQGLARTAAAIHAAGKRVVFVGPPPTVGEDMSRCIDRRRLGLYTVTDYPECTFTMAQFARVRAPVLGFLARVQQRGIVPVVYLHDRLCAGGTCRTSLDGIALYKDPGHLNISGSRLLGRRMQWWRWFEASAR